MSKPKVSIVIVNLNGKRFMDNCLKSVARLSLKPSFEVIVVDNGSNDGSKQVIKRFVGNTRLPARAIFNDANLGFCHANNQGARLARGDYLLFLNNDTEVPPDLLEKLVAKLKADQTIGIIQPKILLKDEPGRLDSVGGFLTWTGFLNHLAIHHKDVGQYDYEFPILSPKGACMMISKKLFKKIGDFDEDFFAYFEETDLAWRVWLAGKQGVFYPEVSIKHLMGRTTRQLEFDFIQFHSFKNRIATLLKNLGASSFWRIAMHLVIVLGLALFYTVIGRFNSAQPIFLAIGWNIRKLPATLHKRRRIQQERLVDDRFIKLVSKPLPIGKAIHDVFWYAKHGTTP